jgi:hypothetical protein
MRCNHFRAAADDHLAAVKGGGTVRRKRGSTVSRSAVRLRKSPKPAWAGIATCEPLRKQIAMNCKSPARRQGFPWD